MAIGSADIDLDGITVIVGNNNTGKSTAGKVLWTMFHALSGLNEKIYNERVEGCVRAIRLKTSGRSFFSHGYSIRKHALDYARQLVNKTLSVDQLMDKLQQEYEEYLFQDNFSPDWDALKKGLQEILAIQDNELRKQVVLTEFEKGLGKQFVPLFKEHGTPSVFMTIKGKQMGVRFTNNQPEIELQLDLQNNAYYFDNPSLLEDTPFDNLYSEERDRIVESFMKGGEIVEDILLRKRYEVIGAQLASILNGEIKYDKDNQDFCLESSKYTDLLLFSSLSQGVKSMATLQAAFSRGAVGEKDVLILDEPEIHLHPEWQVKYAELIVQLQKAFDLTVLLTSHSPDFVEAIRLYSQKYGSEEKLNGYISAVSTDNDTVTIQKIAADDWDVIFDKFARSVDMLIELRSEMEGKSDE